MHFRYTLLRILAITATTEQAKPFERVSNPFQSFCFTYANRSKGRSAKVPVLELIRNVVCCPFESNSLPSVVSRCLAFSFLNHSLTF